MNSHSARRLSVAVVIVTAAAIGSMVAAERTSRAMAAAGSKFLASLTPEQRQQATFAFDGDERTHWHFIPTEMFPRRGLLIRNMTEPQRAAARDLLKTGLSQRGYLTASSIMDLETVLKALEVAQRAAAAQPPTAAPLVRDTER